MDKFVDVMAVVIVGVVIFGIVYFTMTAMSEVCVGVIRNIP